MTERIRLNEENRKWWTLAAMCFALFMIMLDNTVVNVALPSIQRDLHASISSLEWTVNAYTLTFAVLLVTGGRLGDIFGRRTMFLFGVIVFALSSAFIGFAPTQEVLVIGRAQRSGCHHEAYAKGNAGKPQGPGQRAGLQHPEAGFGIAHRAVPIHNFRNARGSTLRGIIAHTAGVRIDRDQGAFAAGTPRKESYNRPATPATMATSARLNTYQL